MDKRLFKPKGLAIYRHKTGRVSLDGRTPAYEPPALFKSKGRTGARIRSLFSRASEGQRLKALYDWQAGNGTYALAQPDPNHATR